jgi:hypothetical protein
MSGDGFSGVEWIARLPIGTRTAQMSARHHVPVIRQEIEGHFVWEQIPP